jgi:hypothetical protein
VHPTGSRKQAGHQENQRSHGDRHRTAPKSPCKGKTAPNGRKCYGQAAVRRICFPREFLIESGRDPC